MKQGFGSMSLLLSIIHYPENCTISESSKTFSEQGGTIGRSANNFWVLNDPDCYLSSCHSEISFNNGHYVLTDLSTNGTFLNNCREPVGNGNKVELQDGDEIELSDYKFRINIWPTYNQKHDSAEPFIGKPVLENEIQNHDISLIPKTEEQQVASLIDNKINNTDPLEALEQRGSISISNIISPGNGLYNHKDQVSSTITQSEHGEVISNALEWPVLSQDKDSIPENWNEAYIPQTQDSNNHKSTLVNGRKLAGSSVANELYGLRNDNEALKKNINELESFKNENSKLKAEIFNLKKKYLNTKYQRVARNCDKSVAISMGLKDDNINQEDILSLNKQAGSVVRETITGMMKILSTRNTIKNEFRMNITTIQPVENNPLKFSATTDDAIENMFIRKGVSYKKPVEAIRDGFEGIAEHQVAIIAGIKAAYGSIIDHLNAESLENMFKVNNFVRRIPFFKKYYNWIRFESYCKELSEDTDNSFQNLFGDEFVRAYEDHLQKLMIARTKQKSK